MLERTPWTSAILSSRVIAPTTSAARSAADAVEPTHGQADGRAPPAAADEGIAAIAANAAATPVAHRPRIAGHCGMGWPRDRRGGDDEPVAPSMSIMLRTFAAEDPGGWQPVLDLARAADAAGVDRVVVSDHVVFGENIDAYGRPETGGVEGGKQPTGPDGHWLEPLTVLSVLCGITSRTRLGTNILLAALRRPVVLAKTAATIDVLSGGRFDLGVGIGWQREEYEAAGLDWSRRGCILDDTLEVCQALWRDTRASVAVPGLSFDGVHMMPKPI